MFELEQVCNENMPHYSEYEKAFETDLNQYQSRIYPSENAEVLRWYHIKADDKYIGAIWLEKNTDEDFAVLGIFIADELFRNKGIGKKVYRCLYSLFDFRQFHRRLEKPVEFIFKSFAVRFIEQGGEYHVIRSFLRLRAKHGGDKPLTGQLALHHFDSRVRKAYFYEASKGKLGKIAHNFKLCSAAHIFCKARLGFRPEYVASDI